MYSKACGSHVLASLIPCAAADGNALACSVAAYCVSTEIKPRSFQGKPAMPAVPITMMRELSFSPIVRIAGAQGE